MMNLTKIVAVAVLNVITAASLFAVGSVQALDPQDVRSFSRFEQDPSVIRGIWVEAGAINQREKFGNFSDDTDVTTVGVRAAFGDQFYEISLFMPYHVSRTLLSYGYSALWQGVEVRGFSSDENGFGDLVVNAKVLPIDSKWGRIGAGLDVSLPTGDAHFDHANETGFLPYLTVGAGPPIANLRVHAGYRAYTDVAATNTSQPEHHYVYGGGLFSSVVCASSGTVGLRAELLGTSYDQTRSHIHFERDLVQFQPGVDLTVPAGPIDLVFRLTGAHEVTSGAPDWGIGGSVALAWDPNRE